jgi:putative ABC transport system permease protein
MLAAIDLGLLYAVMAIGVYMTFKILNFPDLTVDGSFTTGAGTAAVLIVNGVPAAIATLAAAVTGALAGLITGLLHTKGKIDGLLAGIITMIALWSINLRIMGASNIALLRETTLVSPLRQAGLTGTFWSILIFVVVVMILKLVIDWFLSTDLGLAIQANGNNEQMIRAFGVNTHRTTILTLMVSNALVGLSGAFVGQYQGFVDITMGVGLILIGLASVILGQAIFGRRNLFIASLSAVIGAVLYRLIIYFALEVGFNPNDMKLITAVLVMAALLLPRWGFLKRITTLRQLRARAAVSDLTKSGA